MRSVALLWRVSRPRFWLYLGGTYLVGYAAGVSVAGDFLRPSFWWHLLFFLVPANVFLYGVNDLADADTDRLNPKKGAHEHRLRAEERTVLGLAVGACAVMGLGLAAAAAAAAAGRLAAAMLAFLLLGLAYSAPPARLKARPGLDSAANVLYAVPGLLGYVQSSGTLPPAVAVVGAAAWTAAMHLLSAVPDIAPDSEAGLATTATVLGARRSLAACALLWTVALACALATVPGRPILWLAAVYPALALALAVDPRPVARVYWAFPAINAAAGGLLFALAVARLAG